MRDDCRVKFGVKVDKREDGMWSFGICLSHFVEETYLYINLFRWSISIGYLYDYSDDYFVDNF